MSVCIFGAGSIGSYLAAQLAGESSMKVSAVGRGPHLRAIAKDGVRLVDPRGEKLVRLAAAVETSADLPPQDIVFVTLKANSLPAAADDIARLLKPDGHAVFVTNGVPWWWNYGLETNAKSLMRLDPDGRLWNELGPQHVLGCVINSGNRLGEPGTVHHAGNNHWICGEPDGSRSERLARTVQLLGGAGLNAEATSDIRREVWLKLQRNVPFSAIGALTRLGAGGIATMPGLIEIGQQAIGEVVAVASAMGWDIPAHSAHDMVQAVARLAESGPVSQEDLRPSMLWDVMLGRQLESEAILGQVSQFGAEAGVTTPTINLLFQLLEGINLAIRSGASQR